MKVSRQVHGVVLFALVPLWCGGCDPEDLSPAANKPTENAPNRAPVPKVKAKRTVIGKNILLEVQGNQRRVIVNAEVVLREGPLELLMTIAKKKEHEAILAADVDARLLNAALIAANAKPGAPVQFEPKYKPAHGSVIKVSVQYQKNGQWVTLPAQQWIINQRTKKPLDQDWVFGGSMIVPNPLDNNKPVFLAHQDGDVICISNFESALLDLPVKISKVNEELFYEANTKLIPKEKTKVAVILEPVTKK